MVCVEKKMDRGTVKVKEAISPAGHESK